jgi:hypothetical protein
VRGVVDTKRATQLKECGWRSKAEANLRRRWDFEIHIRDAYRSCVQKSELLEFWGTEKHEWF